MVAQPNITTQQDIIYPDLDRKLLFYDRYGVEEYYLYDPDKNDLSGCIRHEDYLAVIEDINGWVSPRLQIRFELSSETLQLYRPDGQRFLTPLEVEQQLQQERQRAEQATTELEQERQRAERLEQLLREAGIDPEQI